MKKVFTTVLFMIMVVSLVLSYACAKPPQEKPEAELVQTLTFELNSQENGYILKEVSKSNEKSLIIPSEYDGKAVVAIAAGALKECVQLETVAIPASVMFIGDNVFSECINLNKITVDENNENYTSIGDNLYTKNGETLIKYAVGKSDSQFELPSTVKEIETKAFYNGASLSRVVLNDGLKTIGDRAFENCTSLVEVGIPESVESLGSSVLQNCMSLESITVADNNVIYKSIDDVLYSKDGKTLIQYPASKDETIFVVPNGVEIIKNNAFLYSKFLSNLTLPMGVLEVESSAFANGKSLVNLTILDKDTVVAVDAFLGCSIQYANIPTTAIKSIVNINLEEVVISSGEKIGDYAFSRCASLKKITIEEGLTEIGYRAFSGCTFLKEIRLASSIVSIGDWAFDDCISLDYYEKDGLKYLGNENNNYIYLEDTASMNVSIASIDVGCKFIGDEAFLNCTSLTEVIIPQGVVKIGAGAFENCYELERATIPNSVEGISKKAFYYCKNVVEITIPDSVTELGNSSFAYCKIEKATMPAMAASYVNNSNLKEVVLTSGEELVANAFAGCKQLTSVSLPNSLVFVGDDAFKDCDALEFNTYNGYKYLGNESNPYLYLASAEDKTIQIAQIDSNCKIIGYSAFEGCSQLNTVEMPSSIVNVCESAFYNCTRLENLVIQEGVVNFSANAFYGCSRLANVTLPDSLVSIGDSAFRGCSKMETVIFGAGVETIEANAFYGCSKLVNATLPNSLTKIGDSAFRGCSGLQTIYFGTSVETIGINAFYECKALTSIELPDSLLSLGNNAFSSCSKLQLINFGNGVKEFGNKVFYECKALTSIELPNSLISLGESVFEKCVNLKEVVIADSVKSIGKDAFKECNIEIATMPTTAISYVKNAGLKDVILTSGEEIRDNAFSGCVELTSVSLPNSLIVVGKDAFNGCDVLQFTTKDGYNYLGNQTNQYLYLDHVDSKEIELFKIDNNCKIIGSSVFEECNALTSVEIPVGVTTISSRAFCKCESLASVVISNTVTSIGNYAFQDCSSLTSITFNGTMEEWKAIKKGSKWNKLISVNEVICSDGKVYII